LSEYFVADTVFGRFLTADLAQLQSSEESGQ